MRLDVSLACFPLAVALAACETQALDGRNPGGLDGGGTATAPTLPSPGVALRTFATFDLGLRADLFAGVDPGSRTADGDIVIDGVSVLASYGVDELQLQTAFSIGAERTLWFGGQHDATGTRNPRALVAADRLWTALSAATETYDQRGVTRTTRDGRAACSRIASAAGTAEIAQCALTGLQHLAIHENQPSP
jgi:hypothetical protein